MPFKLYAAGSNSHGQLGIGSRDDAHSFTPVLFPPDFDPTHQVTSLAFGGTHSLALVSDGTASSLYVAGSNARSQLGRPASEECCGSFTQLPVEVLFEALSMADRSSLGDTSKYHLHGIAAAWETSFVHLRSSERQRPDVLVAMGANDWGELGLGDTPPASHVTLVPLWKAFSLKHDTVSQSNRTFSISALLAGPRHIIVSATSSPPVDENGSLTIGWGAARHGQLGSQFPAPYKDYRPPRTHSSPTILSLPSRLLTATPSRFRHLAIGRDHSAIASAPSLLLLGSNKQGQLGPYHETFHGTLDFSDPSELGVTSPLITSLSCTWTGTYITLERPLAHSPEILALGTNSHSQLARPVQDFSFSATPVLIPLPSANVRKILKVACGSEHVVVLTEEESERCAYGWGWNEHGNLATGGTEDVVSPTRLRPTVAGGVGGGGKVIDVWAGNATSWMLVEE